MKVKTSTVSTVISRTWHSVALKLVTGSVTSGTTGQSANGLPESNITFAPDLYAQVGAYEYNPENFERGKGCNLSTDGSQGAIIPAEVVWHPELGAAKLTRRIPCRLLLQFARMPQICKTHSKPAHNKAAGLCQATTDST